MADKSTDLTVTDGGADGALIAGSDLDVESQNPDLEERSSAQQWKWFSEPSSEWPDSFSTSPQRI